MTNKLLPALERILLALWVGALWVTGFIVAPTLFAELDDRALAGNLAGSLFTLISYLGLCFGSLLLLINVWTFRSINWRANILLSMLLLVVIGQYVVTPMVVELRDLGLTGTTRFGQLHGLAGALFLLTSLLGLVLVAVGRKNSA